MKSDTSDPSVLSKIEAAANDQPNFEVIVYRSCEILGSIERWDHASSESPFVTDIIHRVQEQGALFKSAIRSSRESAQHGSKFCADFVTLLEALEDLSISKDEIRDHIRSMRTIASEARASAQDAAETFQLIRHGIYAITNDVPGEVVKLEEQQKHVQKKLDIAERRVRRAKVVKAVSAAGAAIVAGVSVVAFPPAMIVLPVMFPLIILVSQGIEWKLAKQVQKREKEKTSYEEQIAMLKDVADTMVEFGSAVDFFAQYWIRMETILHTVSGRVDDLRGKEHLRMRLMTIKKDWEVVNTNFSDYVHKVKTLESYCRPIGSSTSSASSIMSSMTSARSMALGRNNVLISPRKPLSSPDRLQIEASASSSSLLAPPSGSRSGESSQSISSAAERPSRTNRIYAPKLGHRATKSEQGPAGPFVVQVTSPPEDSDSERQSRPSHRTRAPNNARGPPSRPPSADSRSSSRSIRISPPSRSPSIETRGSSRSSSCSSLSPNDALSVSLPHSHPFESCGPPRNSSYSSLSHLTSLSLSVPFSSPRSSSVDTRGSSRAPSKQDMLSVPPTSPRSAPVESHWSPPHRSRPQTPLQLSRSLSGSPQKFPPDLPSLEELRIRRESGGFGG